MPFFRRTCININIIFITGYSEYLGETFKIHTSGYILKPIIFGMVQAELDDLRRPISALATKLLKVQ